MKIQVRIDKVYGKEVIRPVCQQAQLFVQLIGQKTFTQRDINIMKKIGVEFDVISAPSQEFIF